MAFEGGATNYQHRKAANVRSGQAWPSGRSIDRKSRWMYETDQPTLQQNMSHLQGSPHRSFNFLGCQGLHAVPSLHKAIIDEQIQAIACTWNLSSIGQNPILYFDEKEHYLYKINVIVQIMQQVQLQEV